MAGVPASQRRDHLRYRCCIICAYGDVKPPFRSAPRPFFGRRSRNVAFLALKRGRYVLDRHFLSRAGVDHARLSAPRSHLILLLEGHQPDRRRPPEGGRLHQRHASEDGVGGDALKEAVKGCPYDRHRSRAPKLTEVFEAADKLMAVGCFSVGTNQVDLQAAAGAAFRSSTRPSPAPARSPSW